MVDAVNTSANTTTTATSTSKSNSSTSKQDFLMLLVTELQNQDPLEPMDNKDMMAQVAQFSTLEEIQNLNKQVALTQAIGLVGAKVVAKEGSEEIQGIVDSVKMSGDDCYLIVGDKEVELSDLVQVSSPLTTSNDTETKGDN
ncbi:flagellar hook capping FlgD N-terminal domain-containing protein [Bacillota bacterium LX-D]|nr:flagellar hook capping FlgD N-terminal domain-containing protein [Bacillota bacterium LX-D]